MTVYCFNSESNIKEYIISQDIANEETFNREMDELFPFGWSLDRADLEDDEYRNGQDYHEDRGDN